MSLTFLQDSRPIERDLSTASRATARTLVSLHSNILTIPFKMFFSKTSTEIYLEVASCVQFERAQVASFLTSDSS